MDIAVAVTLVPVCHGWVERRLVCLVGQHRESSCQVVEENQVAARLQTELNVYRAIGVVNVSTA